MHLGSSRVYLGQIKFERHSIPSTRHISLKLLFPAEFRDSIDMSRIVVYLVVLLHLI